MAVGKPDFELNSFGIQYKEKKVNYTNKKNITVTTAAEEAREQAKWSKMNTPLEVQSNNSKKRGEPEIKPNAAQAVGSAPIPAPEPEPKQNYTRGYQQPKDETQQATSSPPVESHEDTSSSVDRIPHATRVRAGGIVDLHGGKGTQNSQARGNDLSTLVGQEGGSTHVKMDPNMNPSKQLSGGKGDKLAQAKVEESKQNPINPAEKPQDKISRSPSASSTNKPDGRKTPSTGSASADISKSNEIILKMNIMKLDLMEIKKNKNWGDTPDPVIDEIDVEGNPIKVKPHPQKAEVFTDINGNNAHQNPTPISGGGYAGKWRRTGKKDADGNPIKIQQTKDNTVPKKGQVPTPRKNNVQYGKLGEESTEQVKESFDYHTNSPKWQEAINRDAELTTEQGTEKFDDTPANRALRDKIAMREHKKKLAAEKKKKLKKSISEINSMTDGMKELMKGKGYSKINTQRFHPDKPDTHPYNFDETTQTGNYKGAKIHGDKDDKKRAFKKIDDDIETGKVKEIESATLNASKLIKSDASETIYKAISLKSDLMKRSGDLNTYGGFGDVLPTELKQDFQGQSTAERIGEKGKVDAKPTPEGKGAPKGTGNTDKKDIDKWEQRYDKIKNPHHTWRDGTGFGKMSTGNKAPEDLKRKAAETIFKAISLKLDLMKEYDRSKDVLRPEGVKEGKGKISYETPCVNCGRPYKKGETELKRIAATNEHKRVMSEQKEEDNRLFGKDL